MVRRHRAVLAVVGILALVAAGCLGPVETLDAEAPAEAEPAPGTAPDAPPPASPAPAPGPAPEAGATTPPGLEVALTPRPTTRPETLVVDTALSLTGAMPGDHALRLTWRLDGSSLATESLAWGPDDDGLRVVSRSFPAPPGAASLWLVASWDTEDNPAGQAEAEVVVPAGVRLILDADPGYTNDVGQPSFHADWLIPLYPWDGESALDVLDRASGLKGFAYDAVYHADLDAHYVRMINGTEEVWLDPLKLVSRSWMILHNGTLAGAGSDHLIPAAGDIVEFRYVQCYATGHCDGVG